MLNNKKHIEEELNDDEQIERPACHVSKLDVLVRITEEEQVVTANQDHCLIHEL